jgi:acetyltransferase-like isoleucine patch superfamily enzyme
VTTHDRAAVVLSSRDRGDSQWKITVADDVWLGGVLVVCPGVRTGADTVSARAVVTRLPWWSLAVEAYDVAVGGAANGAGSVLDNDPSPPAAVDPVEGDRSTRRAMSRTVA